MEVRSGIAGVLPNHTSPDEFSAVLPSQDVSSQDNPCARYLVFPLNRNLNVPAVQRVLETYAIGGVDTIESENRPDFGGILFWSCYADTSMVEDFQKALGDDVNVRK